MKKRRVLTAVAAAVTVAALGFPGIASANKVVTATVASNATCSNGQIMTGAQFKLGSAPSPTFPIVVSTLNTGNLSPAPSSTGGGTNTYNVTFDAPLADPAKPATASVSDTWNSTFQMTAASCKPYAVPTVMAQGPQPGIRASVAVHIANPNDIMVTYKVGVASFADKPLKVLAHGTGEVDFPQAVCGTTYAVAVSDSYGTPQTATAAAQPCPPSPATPASPSPSPVKTPTAKASPPSASPSDSTTPQAFSTSDSAIVPIAADGSTDGTTSHAAPHHTADDLPWWIPTLGLMPILGVIGFCCIWITRRRHSDDSDVDDTLTV